MELGAGGQGRLVQSHLLPGAQQCLLAGHKEDVPKKKLPEAGKEDGCQPCK